MEEKISFMSSFLEWHSLMNEEDAHIAALEQRLLALENEKFRLKAEIHALRLHSQQRQLKAALSPENVVALKKWILATGLKDEDPDALVFGTKKGGANSYQNLYYR